MAKNPRKGGNPANPPKERARAARQERAAAERAAAKRRTLRNRSLIAVAVVAAAALLGYLIYQMQQAADLPNPQAKPASSYAIPANSDKAGTTVGNAAAPVSVEFYEDYRCPHCKELTDALGERLDSKVANGEIKLIYHPIAILSGYSVLASSAAGCAADENAFERFNKALFDKQGREGLSTDDLVQIGADVGLKSTKFRQCVEDTKYQNWVLGLRKPSKDRDVEGTPTVFVNDKKLEPTQEAPAYADRIESEINAAIAKARGQ